MIPKNSSSELKPTPEQQAIIDHKKPGSLLVIAGPGTGKTTTLLARLGNVYENNLELKNQQYIVLCFTNTAVTNLKNKFVKERPKNFAKFIHPENIHFGTVHSAARNILSKNNVAQEEIGLSTGEREDVIKLNIQKFLSDPWINHDFSQNPIFQLLDVHPEPMVEPISKIRGQQIKANDIEELRKVGKEAAYRGISEFNDKLGLVTDEHIQNFLELFLKIITGYLEKPVSETERQKDFFDDIEDALMVLKTSGGESGKNLHIFVDEFQDINKPQGELIRCHNPGQLFVVGDPRQAIFSFQGSDEKIINDFTNFDNTLHLTHAFRFKSEGAMKLLNSIISNSDIEGKKQLMPLQHSPTIKLKKGFFHEMQKFPTLKDGNDGMLGKIMMLKQKCRENGKRSPSIAIIFRSKNCPKLQRALIKEQIKIPMKDRDKKSGDIHKGHHFQIYKIFLSILLINCKNLKYGSNKYINNEEDFVKIISGLTSRKTRMSTEDSVTLSPTEAKNLGKSFCEYPLPISLLSFIFKEYSPITQVHKSFALFMHCCRKGLDNGEIEPDGKLQFARGDLMPLFNETIWKPGCEFGKTPLLEKNLGQKRNGIISAFSKFTSISDIFNLLSVMTIGQEKNYSDEVVRMMNVHKAKGREFDYVFINAFDVNKGPPKYSISSETNEFGSEEGRVFFVACSRAKIKIFLYHTDGKMSPIGKKLFGPENSLITPPIEDNCV